MKTLRCLIVFLFLVFVPLNCFCKSITISPSTSIAKQMSRSGVTYKIKNDIDLQGSTINVPEECTLYFKGGTIRNGTIVGHDTKIKAKDYTIFPPGITKYHGYVKNGSYSYSSRTTTGITISGTWSNSECKPKWTGLANQDSSICSSKALNNYIKIHKAGTAVSVPKGKYSVYGSITINNWSLDFNGSSLISIDFSQVEDKTIPIPKGATSCGLKSIYGLLRFQSSESYLKNVTIDGRSQSRNEEATLGSECLISMESNKSAHIQNVHIMNAVDCGICTYEISDVIFDKVTFECCGEHGIYTHAYHGVLTFNECNFVNCGQSPEVYKQRGQSACFRAAGSRDRSFEELKDLKIFFNDCSFNSTGKYPVATMYSDIPYAVFNRCRWENVNGYSVSSPSLSEGIGRLVEYIFVDCDNPCSKIVSHNTIRRLIRCRNVKNPFPDTVEITNCEISASYADVTNLYEGSFEKEVANPIVIKNTTFTSEDGTSIRNTIKNCRPMYFENCQWTLRSSDLKDKGSFYIVLQDDSGQIASTSISFQSCTFDTNNYRLLYSADSDIEIYNCVVKSHYNGLICGNKNKPNKITIIKTQKHSSGAIMSDL